MFWTFEAVFKLKNLRKLHILRLRARSVICIKDRQNSQEGGTTFARHVQILPRHRLTNPKRFLCFNQQQITKELGPGFPELFSTSVMRKREELWGREWWTSMLRLMRPVKTRYLLTSIMWSYRGLKRAAHRGYVIFEVDRWPSTGFRLDRGLMSC